MLQLQIWKPHGLISTAEIESNFNILTGNKNKRLKKVETAYQIVELKTDSVGGTAKAQD